MFPLVLPPAPAPSPELTPRYLSNAPCFAPAAPRHNTTRRAAVTTVFTSCAQLLLNAGCVERRSTFSLSGENR